MSTKPEQPLRPPAQFLCDSAGSILSIHVRGEIDHHTASAIRQGIDAALFEKRPKKFILDLSAVSFMDSSGLGLIMGRYSVMKELEGEMVVWNPSPQTRSIITLAGMERMVRIEYPSDDHSTEEHASAGRHPKRSAAPGGGTSPRKRKKSPVAAVAAGSNRKERDA